MGVLAVVCYRFIVRLGRDPPHIRRAVTLTLSKYLTIFEQPLAFFWSYHVVFHCSTKSVCYLYVSVAGATRQEMNWVLQLCKTYKKTEPAISDAIDWTVELENLPVDCTVLDINRFLDGILTL